MARKWNGEITLQARAYVCGYCGLTVGPDKGTFSQEGTVQTYVFFCSHCGQPTYFDQNGRQFPGIKFGNNVKHLPKDIEQLYGEAGEQCRPSHIRLPCLPVAKSL